jgi:hypothetical protein
MRTTGTVIFLALVITCFPTAGPAKGQVLGHQKISETEGGFTGDLDLMDWFGTSVANLGDVDDDGVIDLAVGAIQDTDGGGNARGAVWILFLNTDGSVKSHQKISDTEGNFTGILDDNDSFGMSVAGLGDLDDDGVEDLAVGAFLDDDGGPGQSNRGGGLDLVPEQRRDGEGAPEDQRYRRQLRCPPGHQRSGRPLDGRSGRPRR